MLDENKAKEAMKLKKEDKRKDKRQVNFCTCSQEDSWRPQEETWAGLAVCFHFSSQVPKSQGNVPN